MKRLIVVLVVIFMGTHYGIAQGFEKHTDVSVHLGIQNPVEVAFLDFAGSGPGDYFEPGFIIGAGISREWRRISLSLRSSYMHNELKNFTDVEQNNSLHNFSVRGDFWVNILNPESRFRLEIGTGLGAIFFRHPGSTFIMEDRPDEPGWTFVKDSYTSMTVSLNFGINLEYKISERIDVFGALGNDFVLYYGEEETAVLKAFTLGISYKI